MLTRIGDTLGIEKPREPILHKTFTGEAEIAEIKWNNWLNTIRERIIALSQSMNTMISYEYREGFIYDPSKDLVKSEISDKKSLEEIRSITPTQERVIDGSGPLRFYEFVLITLNKTILSGTRSVNLYLGYNVYGSVVFIRANSTSTTNSYLSIKIDVINTDTGEIIWSKTYN